MTALKDRYLELWRVGKSFQTKKGEAEIVRDFNLTICQGEFVSLIGHSGCGKSTVLSMLAGLADLSAGGIVLAGREINGAGPDRGMVFQSPNLLPWFTAFQNVMLGVDQVFNERSKAERKSIVEHYLALVGLEDAMHKRPAELSQGMRQRVGLARAFALNPKVLLLDEPFGMLDSLTRMDLQDVLIELCARDGKTAVMVTHDVDEAIFLSDRVVMMTSGPSATIGEIMTVDAPRPRDREQFYDDATFRHLRENLVAFLEDADRHASPFATQREPIFNNHEPAKTSTIVNTPQGSTSQAPPPPLRELTARITIDNQTPRTATALATYPST